MQLLPLSLDASLVSVDLNHVLMMSQFKVPEELVGLLVDMGYEQGEAKMALQMPNLDFEGRLNFLDEERERLKRRWQEGDMWLTEIE